MNYACLSSGPMTLCKAAMVLFHKLRDAFCSFGPKSRFSLMNPNYEHIKNKMSKKSDNNRFLRLYFAKLFFPALCVFSSPVTTLLYWKNCTREDSFLQMMSNIVNIFNILDHIGFSNFQSGGRFFPHSDSTPVPTDQCSEWLNHRAIRAFGFFQNSDHFLRTLQAFRWLDHTNISRFLSGLESQANISRLRPSYRTLFCT